MDKLNKICVYKNYSPWNKNVPKHFTWIVWVWGYKPVTYEHHYAALAFAIYVERNTPAKVMEKL